MSKTLCFTGHRPNKLNGYNVADNLPLLKELSKSIESYIVNHNVEAFICGMAQGVDMWSALMVLKAKEKYPHIKLICAIPCHFQYKPWEKHSPLAVQLWKKIYVSADKRVYVSEEPYTHWCLQKRNEYMVDNSDIVLAVWDGSTGGTKNCVDYAIKEDKAIDYINPLNFK